MLFAPGLLRAQTYTPTQGGTKEYKDRFRLTLSKGSDSEDILLYIHNNASDAFVSPDAQLITLVGRFCEFSTIAYDPTPVNCSVDVRGKESYLQNYYIEYPLHIVMAQDNSSEYTFHVDTLGTPLTIYNKSVAVFALIDTKTDKIYNLLEKDQTVTSLSGKKVLRRQLKYLFKTLQERQIAFEHRFTQYANHASEIARELVENGLKQILVVGGDGTFSEVVNGIFSAKNVDPKQLKIALIPHGTGNDWGRFWGLTRDYKQSIDVFFNGNTQVIDIGVAEYYRNNELQQHYFANSIGFGLDYRVVHETHHLKYCLGSHSILYFIGLLRAVFTFKLKQITIQTPEMTYSGKVFTMNIGNGCYSGGGMKQNPAAVPTDGFFDAMFAFKPTLKDIVTAIPLVFNGKLTKHTLIKTIHSAEIELQTPDYLPFEADGIEVHAMGPCKVRILPLSIQMVC
ncbi:hypothetical protein FACS189413_18280 [Bacteroidia bacterium]|nr:hypothetical protein FACS189413_18280 [Bacteroidia bacterium]